MKKSAFAFLGVFVLLFGLVGPAAAQKAVKKAAKADQKAAKGTSSRRQAAEPKVEIDPLDWPNWRGPEQNRVSRERGLIDKWDRKGENILWKSTALATRSTPIVMRGKLYTLCSHEPGTNREAEKVVCADAATGDILWENVFNVFLSDVPKERVGWSCCVGDPETGRVYSMGVGGYFQCLDGDTGKTIWSHSLSEEFGLLSTYGGRTNVPVIFEDMVLISSVIIGWGEMAVPAHRFMAFNKETGKMVWFNGTTLRPPDTTYSTPTLCVLNGQAAMVFGSSDGNVWAFQPRTGQPIWRYQLSQRGLNVSPLVDDGIVYMAQSEENPDDSSMGAIAAIRGDGHDDVTKSGEVWRQKEVMVGRSAPIKVGDRIYAFDDSNLLYIFDAATGQPIGNKVRLLGTITRASPLYADGKIYACTTEAWHVIEPTEDGAKIVHRQRFGQGEEVNGSPIASHGRIYLPTTEAIYCLGVKDATPMADERPAQPAEEPIGDNTTPAHIQVRPAESLIAPGDSVEFTAFVYNSRGQLLGKAEYAQFTASAGGQIDENGRFTSESFQTANGSLPVGSVITAKVGELSGKARVRIVPPLPWKFDFTTGEVPAPWNGIRYRHVVVDFDLLESLSKDLPRAAELYIYLTSGFVNGATDKLALNDRTPRRTWTELMRYLALEKDPALKTLAGAQAELVKGLERLQADGVLAKWELTSVKDGDLQLAVERGPRKVEGNGVMVKIITIPLGTRSQGWMGPIDLHDYTIQADLRGAIRNGKLPDMGLIAQRYTFDVQGVNQVLQIRTWTPELHRFSKTVPFAWRENVWYTMKFQASTDGGKAVLKGKLWPRDEKEPADWSIEAVDEAPSLMGSPGLYGNAINAEVFIDNISVTPN